MSSEQRLSSVSCWRRQIGFCIKSAESYWVFLIGRFLLENKKNKDRKKIGRKNTRPKRNRIHASDYKGITLRMTTVEYFVSGQPMHS